MDDLDKHIENLQTFGLPVVIAVNKFSSDTEAELKTLFDHCYKKAGVSIALCEGWEKGGNGCTELAQAVVDAAASSDGKFNAVYDWDDSIENKVTKIAKTIYGAGSVVFQPKAKNDLLTIEKLGISHLPVCIAKTQNSLSDNTKLLGAPEGFKLTVREIEIAAGAGFVIPITGNMLRMPGLPMIPAAEGIDIDVKGNISGLS